MIVNMSPCECGGDGWEAAGEVEVGGLVRRGSVVAVHADLDVAIVHGRLAQHHAQVMEMQRRVNEFSSQQVGVRRLRLENRVNLHLALGGGFAAPKEEAP